KTPGGRTRRRVEGRDAGSAGVLRAPVAAATVGRTSILSGPSYQELWVRKGATMTRELKSGLHVQSDGKRRYISVPAGLARELHNYLRTHRVRSAPPEPAFTGFDSIELADDIDVAGVQTLLNSWT